MTKILICGSRNIDSGTAWSKIREWYDTYEGDVELIIHGGARGIDRYAEEFARNKRIVSKIIRPIDPSKRFDYLYRNVEMIALCDEVVAFWDGKSTGTGFTVAYAQKRNKKVTIIKI